MSQTITVATDLGALLADALRFYVDSPLAVEHGDERVLNSACTVINALLAAQARLDDPEVYISAPTYYDEDDGAEEPMFQFTLTRRSSADWLLALNGKHGLRVEQRGLQGKGFYFVSVFLR